MILELQQRVHDAIDEAARRHFALADVPAFAIETPPTRALGDLAVTVAFQLARTLRKAPRAIAQDLLTALAPIPGIARVVATPQGYLNFYLERTPFLLARTGDSATTLAFPGETPGKTIVEHTAINPNKAAHIGHLRNAALGDTLVRVLRFRGAPVETQNYIDDTGVQVADVIVGFRELEHLGFDEIKAIADSTRFDYYCWDLYARVTDWYDGDPERKKVRDAALHDLEHGGNEVAAMGAFIVNRIVRAHLKTMARLNVGYDLLTYEGDILRLRFWAHAFETLKAQGAVFLQTEGRLKDCWVMRIEEGKDGQEGRVGQEGSEALEPKTDGNAQPAAEEESREKVIVRSNGVVTYVGKDIANQFWKFGLLGKDFYYRRFAEQADGTMLWATTWTAGESGAPAFGRGKRIYNVIDSRQAYLQALLSQALRTLGHARESVNSIHFSYEMVALSHATAQELGYPPPEGEDARKPFVEVSGRKGLGVKIDDLLDVLTSKAAQEVGKRNSEFTPEDCQRVGMQIAVGAIRYFMLKFSRGKLIVFDMEEALSFEGETGPYLQYTVVRANNIFLKLKEREGLTEADILTSLGSLDARELETEDASEAHSLWALVFEAARLDEVVEQTLRALEFAVLAKYAFGLAQLFNAFYHRYPILNEESADRRRWRAAGVAYFRAQLTRALDLMGIDVPSRM